MNYDLIIIGGAPAGVAGAVYAARKRLKTLIIAEEVGGQSAVSDTIYNWIGTPEISGTGLAEGLKQHLEYYATEGNTLTLDIGSWAEQVSKIEGGFSVTVKQAKGTQTYTAKSILLATGSRHRQLEVPGAAEYEHKGILYCATCDGPLFSGQPVAVIGGGNAALEAVLQLSAYASHVTLLHRRNEFRADPITVQKVSALDNATLLTNVTLTEVTGEMFVNGLRYKNNGEETEHELAVNAIFVEIGQLPNTDLVKDVVALNEFNKVIVDPANQRTSTLGIWAAGDCTNGLYHQNNIAAGDAVKAVEDLYIWLQKA